MEFQQAYYEMSIVACDTIGMSFEEAACYDKFKQEILKKRGIWAFLLLKSWKNFAAMLEDERNWLEETGTI